MPGMLGWFKMTASTAVEDIEWLMATSASYNAGFAFVTDQKTVKQNGSSDEIFSILNTWENARLEGKFSAALMERMKPLENEFKLKKSGTGSLWITPVYSYKFTHTKKILQPGQPAYSTYAIENKAADQPLRFIITALDESVSGIRIELNGAKTLKIPITLEKGQTLKYTEGSEAIIYDHHWQLVRKIPVNSSLLQCAAGKHQVQVDVRFEGTNEAPKLKLEFLFFGPAEKLEK